MGSSRWVGACAWSPVITREELERHTHAGEEAAALALADALDADGRHGEAIDALSRAAKSGSTTALGRVGARILVGDRAPALPSQGVGLIDEAARAGDADSAAILAALTAAGAFRRQSWKEALDWLVRAAELGSELARGQLKTLASDRDLVAATDASGAFAEVWRRLRASVDVAALTTAPEGRTISEAPQIRAFAGFASEQACDWLIARGAERLKRAEVYAGGFAQTRMSETRTNSARVFNLADTDLVQLFLLARMSSATGIPFSHMESSTVLNYAVGQEIQDHYDFISPETPGYEKLIARDGERIITFLVYLNDDYEGGETAFPRLALEHRGVRGQGLYFVNALPDGKPDLRALHAGRPPTRGEKWVVSQFIRSRPTIPGA